MTEISSHFVKCLKFGAHFNTNCQNLWIFRGPICSAPFFAIAQSSQISKFTKYGHVVYHLICILKLITKKSQNIPKMYFQPIINIYLASGLISMRSVTVQNRRRRYRVTKMVIT